MKVFDWLIECFYTDLSDEFSFYFVALWEYIQHIIVD